MVSFCVCVVLSGCMGCGFVLVVGGCSFLKGVYCDCGVVWLVYVVRVLC